MGTIGLSITLANSIIGVGILAMPFCFQQCGIILATLILLLMGLVSRLCCYFLLKSALIARRRNFEFLAFHVFGSAGKLAVEVGIIGFLMGTCIAYFVVVGDLGPQIIAKIFNINQSDILRTLIMVVVSVVCVLPLGLLRNVDSLSNVSAATIGFYICLVVKVVAEAGAQLAAGARHSRLEMWRPAGVLQCVPIFSMALFCQTQLFEIFESLPSLSLEKMNVVTKNAINICTGVYFTLGTFGYIAFCSQNISGNILMNLSPTWPSDVIKLGFVMSLAFSFPLIIFPCRASLYSLLYKKVHSSHHDHIINHSIPVTTFRCITVGIIACALGVSLLIPNMELVLGLAGSTIGVLVCVLFPAACLHALTHTHTNERLLAKVVMVLGVVIMVLGTYANLQAAGNAPDRYDAFTKERIDKIVEDFFDNMDKAGGNGDVISQDNKLKEIENDDSEIQPPNPVPPESQSNEKHQAEIKPSDEVGKLKGSDLVKNIPDKDDKVSETHPKNLKTKLNGVKIANGDTLIENGKFNNGDTEEQKNIEQPREVKSKTPTTQEKVQEKIDMMKQQQLIETIKQHGVEQKELIKEQKEILDELIKTNEELKQNKKEVDSVEAKKIAVESIQKIANIAIQSLSGVTDKPDPAVKVDKESDPLKKIANDAVQAIAKKTVETIEAIKEIKSAPKVDNNVIDIIGNIANGQAHNNALQIPVQTQIQSNQIVAQNPQAQVQNNLAKQPIPEVNGGKPVPPASDVQPAVQNGNAPSINKQGNEQPIANHVINAEDKVAIIPAQIMDQNINQINPQVQTNNNNVENQKPHSHSPDEPQSSYKQGGDSQKEPNINKDSLKLPIPIAMNENSQLKNKDSPQNVNAKMAEAIVKDVNYNVNVRKVQNGAIKDISNNQYIVNADTVIERQKREVIYCAENMLLKPEGKEICKSLVDQQLTDILPANVDLNDAVLPKSLPIDTMIHHMRSLKSVDYHETEKKR